MNAGRISVSELLVSSDPLSDSACLGLLSYHEEDDLVDFKEKFDPSSQKSWIELAVDAVAFANTNGGYIVFGVADKTWATIGLTDTAVAALSDTKKVLEKINRSLVPVLTRVRSREIKNEGNSFVVLYSPCEPNATHVFESNLTWSPDGKKEISLVSKGSIYIRRVASNQVLTSADFELLIERRLKHFREKIIEGLVRVVHAPPGHEV
jgi:predicted HTH transcriptional regulator